VGFRLGHFSAVLVAATLALSAGSALAKPADSQEDPASSQFESLASRLKAGTERALDAASDAAARAVDASKGAIAETETDLGPRLETFRQMLNDQKAKLAMIGEDAVDRFDAWKQAATDSWSEIWSDTRTKSWTQTFTQSWTEFRRAATEALDRFRDWIADQPKSDDYTETPV
jgi:hypothetical protein